MFGKALPQKSPNSVRTTSVKALDNERIFLLVIGIDTLLSFFLFILYAGGVLFDERMTRINLDSVRDRLPSNAHAEIPVKERPNVEDELDEW